jgi:hypothetical protein
MLGTNPHDGKAMYELQLELHSRAEGKRPVISADELLDLHLWLADQDLNFKQLFRKKS